MWLIASRSSTQPILGTARPLHRGPVIRRLPTRVYVTTISESLRLLCILRANQNVLAENVSDRCDTARDFMTDLSIRLAPCAIFRSDFTTTLLAENLTSHEFTVEFPSTDLSLELHKDDFLQDYLCHLQQAYGLRTVTPLFGESARSRRRSIGSYTPNSPRRQARMPNRMDISATSLFLGPELSRYL